MADKSSKLPPLGGGVLTPDNITRAQQPDLSELPSFARYMDAEDKPRDAEKIEYVRITNAKPRLLHLPDLIRTSDRTPDAAPRIAGVGTGKSLKPGGNNVDVRYWALAKMHKEVRTWLKLGWISEGGDVTEPEGVQAPPSLAKFSTDTAVLAVEGEKNPTVLARWLAVEERNEVRAALKTAMEARGAAKSK